MKSTQWIIGFALFLTACSKFGFMGVESVQRSSAESQIRKTLASQLTPAKLEVVPDETTIPARICKGFTVNSRAQNGLLSGVASDLTFTLSSDNTGKFFEDENCTKELRDYMIPKGYYSKRFFFESGPLKNPTGGDSLRIVASTRYFANSAGIPATFSTPPMSIINSRPLIDNADYVTNEDEVLIAQLQATDENGDPLTFHKLTNPLNADPGTLTTLLSSSGRIEYHGANNFNGLDSFQYYVSDGRTNSEARTITIGVNAVNDLPSFRPISAGPFPERQSTVAPGGTVDLMNYLDDVDLLSGLNNPVTDFPMFEIVTGPSRGTATLAGSVLNYRATVYSNRSDSIVVRVTDRGGQSATTTVGISMTAFNNTPVAVNRSLNLIETNASVVGPLDLVPLVLDIDSDPSLNANPQNPPVLTVFQQGTRGSYSFTNKQYVALPDYNGTDTVIYRATDANNANLYSYGTLSISIQATNDIPTASDVSEDITEDTQEILPLLGNDVDLDPVKNGTVSDSLTIVVTPASGPTKGSFNPSNRNYSPSQDATGADSFRYRVRDAQGVLSTEQTVSLNIINVQDPPVLTRVDPKTGAIEDTDFNMTFDTMNTDLQDPDPGQTVSFRVKSIMAGSTLKKGGVPLSVNSTFSLGEVVTWLPPSNANGSSIAAFSLRGWDGVAESASSETVFISVTAVNDPPIISPVSDQEFLNTVPYSFNVSATDIEGHAITYLLSGLTIVSGPGGDPGTASVLGNVITYNPPTGFVGTVDLSYWARDNGSPPAESSSDVVRLFIGDGRLVTVNNGPLCLGGSGTILSNSILQTKVSGIPNVDPQIVYSMGNIPTKGALRLNGVDLMVGQTFTQDDIARGRVRYVQSLGGNDSFDYMVDYLSDGNDVLGPITFEIRTGGGSCP